MFFNHHGSSNFPSQSLWTSCGSSNSHSDGLSCVMACLYCISRFLSKLNLWNLSNHCFDRPLWLAPGMFRILLFAFHNVSDFLEKSDSTYQLRLIFTHFMLFCCIGHSLPRSRKAIDFSLEYLGAKTRLHCTQDRESMSRHGSDRISRCTRQTTV